MSLADRFRGALDEAACRSIENEKRKIAPSDDNEGTRIGAVILLSKNRDQEFNSITLDVLANGALSLCQDDEVTIYKTSSTIGFALAPDKIKKLDAILSIAKSANQKENRAPVAIMHFH